MIERHLRLWERGDQDAIVRMRSSNPEWDFMGRTFLVLALANLAIRQPASARRGLDVMNAVISATVAAQARHSMYFFLLPYAHPRPGGATWRQEPPRSLFIDGEIAMMLAAFLLVAPRSDPRVPAHRRALIDRLELIHDQMRAGPVLSGESYPNECWTFCNTTALVASRMASALGLKVDAKLPHAWLRTATLELTDPRTNMLVSSYSWDGGHLDGPEGSSIWMSAYNLALVDPDYARGQYELAKRALGRQVLGFGFAREWPVPAPGSIDVDSGHVIPLLEASPGSSGLAILAARGFRDQAFWDQLLASLELAGFPEQHDGTRRYRVSNQIGDAVLAYALCAGPLWARVAGTAP
ncbi:hypothetical protein DB30_02744 [Enhygromyxa salina]|uniref:Linalool dehydratase/isomerase domain-containing protein n=1 Tax=Enhygromyxa salina TaxID=215803 RepID=A0A0C2A7G0_9BACT|nr:hypothetical protein DB30_02744 [Enhygromyxa salina]